MTRHSSQVESSYRSASISLANDGPSFDPRCHTLKQHQGSLLSTGPGVLPFPIETHRNIGSLPKNRLPNFPGPLISVWWGSEQKQVLCWEQLHIVFSRVRCTKPSSLPTTCLFSIMRYKWQQLVWEPPAQNGVPLTFSDSNNPSSIILSIPMRFQSFLCKSELKGHITSKVGSRERISLSFLWKLLWNARLCSHHFTCI